MRREGYEFALSRPQVILKNIDGQTMEPYEALVVDIDEAHVGAIMEKLQQRRGEMTDMVNPGTGRVRIEFKIPTRGLFGIRTEFLSETRGTGLLYHTFLEYGPYRGEIARPQPRRAHREGSGRHDRLRHRAAPGTLDALPRPGQQGLRRPDRRRELARRRHGRAGLPQAKHLTNMRASGSDMAVKLTPPAHHDARADAWSGSKTTSWSK